MLIEMLSVAEERELEEIRAFFEERHRRFLLTEHHGAWEALIPITGYPSMPPFACGKTPLEAARNVLALWRERPDLGGNPPNSR